MALVLVVGLVAVVVVAIVVVIVVVVVVVGFVDVVAATQPQLPASCTWAHPRSTQMTVTLVPGCSWAASSCTVVCMIVAGCGSTSLPLVSVPGLGVPAPTLRCLAHALAMRAAVRPSPVMLCRSALVRRSSTSPSASC